MMMVMITAAFRGVAGRRDTGAARDRRRAGLGTAVMMMVMITAVFRGAAGLRAANMMVMMVLAVPRGGTGSGRVRAVVLASNTRTMMMVINGPGLGRARGATLKAGSACAAAFGTADAETKPTVSAFKPSVRPAHRAVNRIGGATD
jgi:hypothetical protein